MHCQKNQLAQKKDSLENFLGYICSGKEVML